MSSEPTNILAISTNYNRIIAFGDITFSPNMSVIFPNLGYDEIINGDLPFGILIVAECHFTSAGLVLPPICFMPNATKEKNIMYEYSTDGLPMGEF